MIGITGSARKIEQVANGRERGACAYHLGDLPSLCKLGQRGDDLVRSAVRAKHAVPDIDVLDQSRAPIIELCKLSTLVVDADVAWRRL